MGAAEAGASGADGTGTELAGVAGEGLADAVSAELAEGRCTVGEGLAEDWGAADANATGPDVDAVEPDADAAGPCDAAADADAGEGAPPSIT